MTLKNCCVCGKDDAPYKCPTCRESYCSVGCCKEHKTQSCEPPVLSEELKAHQSANRWKYDFPTEDTVPMEKLQQLHDSKELKQCLQSSHLRNVMKTVMNSPNPTEAIALAMKKEPIFVEMADACLKVVELPDHAKPC
ncbi:PREDICTED: zinc finger HIT domain-containing protein 3 [Cyphomyrmex costatus]|uniref:Zinc finger HIT domain-containing protein 3 n=1 Tax=Cyphomyrmex costatus TaxID=456900 RepID=A0A151IQ10_9HYME|nr:PREDICTED: zinc finger HIT domain-containing protein 3 [Cyphomyrmex costatus]XP_018397821.1 PREDICTED: zinc finger HIT domain-containing protein 3 [Cyphomyrmex costatus]KYN08210.1 Zinc finger HIT domain-containing protein 3 [Cyphomyrmex costatus]